MTPGGSKPFRLPLQCKCSNLLQMLQFVSFFWGTKTEHSETRSNECWVRGYDPFFQFTTSAPICAARSPLAILGPGHRAAHAQLPTRAPESCSPARNNLTAWAAAGGFPPRASDGISPPWIKIHPNTVLKWITETTSKRRNWRSYSKCLPNKTTHFQPKQGQSSRSRPFACQSITVSAAVTAAAAPESGPAAIPVPAGPGNQRRLQTATQRLA